MSEQIAILLDATRVSAVLPANASAMLEFALDDSLNASLDDSPDDSRHMAAVVERVRAAVGEATSIVLVIGLGLLEIARPDLPPLATAARRALLLRDADRYVPIAEPVAVSWADGFAFAMPAATLAKWVRAFEAIGPVGAIVTLPQLCALQGLNGTFTTTAGAGEVGSIAVRDGLLSDVQRSIASEGTLESGTAAAARALSVRDLLRTASRTAIPLDAQLLDARMMHETRARSRSRLVRSVALLSVAVLALAWAAARRQARVLEETRALAAQLTTESAPARAAQSRLELARAEQRLLSEADSVARGGVTAAAVLARVGALLPRDAFVQRLEWDGVLWRIDGSATDAPGIVPLLDADPHFSDVRIVAASTRFIDAGRQRESFSIAFRTRGESGGARGAQ